MFIIFAFILTIFKLAGAITISWWWIIAAYFGAFLIRLAFGLILATGAAIAAIFLAIVVGILQAWEEASRNRRRRYMKTNEAKRRGK